MLIMFSKRAWLYLFKLYLLCQAVLLLLRISFLVYHQQYIHPFLWSDFFHSLFIGFVFDSGVVCCVFFLLLLILIPLSFNKKIQTEKLFFFSFNVLLAIVFFVNLADIFYYQMFGLRMNMFAAEGLHDSDKIIFTIWNTYPVIRILLVYIVLIFLFYRTHRYLFRKQNFNEVQRKWPWFILTPLTYVAFSFLYYGPPMFTLAEFSNSSVVNQASMNGVYTLIKSVQQNGLYDRDIPLFHFNADKEALHALQKTIVKNNEVLTNDIFPTCRMTTNKDSLIRKNIVIIIMESFGANYNSRLSNGTGFSPQFDRWSHEGVFFTHFRSNGPRTQNGIFSVVSGFPAVLGNHLIRRRGLNEIQTLGSILLAAGYKTQFIHNGHADFDDMDNFLKQGGFQTLFDVNDFTHWRMKNKWGVSDEDLYDTALTKIFSPDGKPVFSVLMTMTNHAPYDIPDSFVKEHPEVAKMEKQQASYFYADYAIGKFLDQCKTNPQFSNTLFFICADHGEAYQPTDNDYKIFHIPALLLNSSHDTGTFVHAAAQCDIAPTLLNEINFNGAYHFIGQNVFASDYVPFAFSRAYSDEVFCSFDSTVIKFKIGAGDFSLFNYDPQQYLIAGDKALISAEQTTFIKNYLQSISWLFRNGKYRFGN